MHGDVHTEDNSISSYLFFRQLLRGGSGLCTLRSNWFFSLRYQRTKHDC